MDEVWVLLKDFPDYGVSNHGRIARIQDEALMSLSSTREGDVKVSLWDEDGIRRTRSVKMLVAREFVFKPRDTFDAVIQHDNDKSNLHSFNLSWRPTWHAWKYVHQFKEDYPPHFYTLPVLNMTTQESYPNIVEASMDNGVLFKDVYRSVYAGVQIFPDWHIYVMP